MRNQPPPCNQILCPSVLKLPSGTVSTSSTCLVPSLSSLPFYPCCMPLLLMLWFVRSVVLFCFHKTGRSQVSPAPSPLECPSAHSSRQAHYSQGVSTAHLPQGSSPECFLLGSSSPHPHTLVPFFLITIKLVGFSCLSTKGSPCFGLLPCRFESLIY